MDEYGNAMSLEDLHDDWDVDLTEIYNDAAYDQARNQAKKDIAQEEVVPTRVRRGLNNMGPDFEDKWGKYRV